MTEDGLSVMAKHAKNLESIHDRSIHDNKENIK